MSDETVGDVCPPFHALASFVYLDHFLKHRREYNIVDWVLDSGAFSAHNSGAVIDVGDFTARAKELRRTDSTLREVFALDVIGDWKASLKNCEWQWGQGLEVIPCFHPGEPWDALEHIARTYPKVALGGVVRVAKSRKMEWFEQCFARIWRIRPVRVHGFGVATRDALMAFPFHSVDATNWNIAAVMGLWYSDEFRKQLNHKIRTSKERVSLRVEVEYHNRLMAEARHRWRNEMAKLEAKDEAPIVRLALMGNLREAQMMRVTPDERLARHWRKDS